MLRWLILLLVFIPVPLLGQAQTAPKPLDIVPLNSVIAQVKAALDEYQQNLGSGADALPPLTSAEFDFKATTTTMVGTTVSLFIFKFGGSHQKEVVNDVTYSYTVPKPKTTKAPFSIQSTKKRHY